MPRAAAAAATVSIAAAAASRRSAAARSRRFCPDSIRVMFSRSTMSLRMPSVRTSARSMTRDTTAGSLPAVPSLRIWR